MTFIVITKIPNMPHLWIKVTLRLGLNIVRVLPAVECLLPSPHGKIEDFPFLSGVRLV
jgi:hypothetical protein